MSERKRRARATESDRRRAGFTLVEVMVATALLGTVLIGMAGTATMGARELRRSKEISVATIKAREAIDEIMARGYDKAVPGSTVQDADAGRFDFKVVTLIQQRADADELRDVTVSVVDHQGREVQRFTVAIQSEDYK